jgi:hypothetical protein
MGSSGGGGAQPAQISPGEAAQAAVGTAGAGEMMSMANQPIEQYGNLATMSSLGPAEVQAQQALAGQGAYQAAQQQQDIQSRVDPMAFAQRQMRLNAATNRLGQLYSQNPSQFNYRAPAAFDVPGTADLPSLDTLRQQGSLIAGQLSTGSVNKSGGDPRLSTPSGTTLPDLSMTHTYF